MSVLELSFMCGESSLAVHRFMVEEEISGMFAVSVWARSESPAIDLEAIVGQEASFSIQTGMIHAKGGGGRSWSGIVNSIELVQGLQVQSGSDELSTYHLRIVPKLWLLTQRRNHRIFQHISIPDIVKQVFTEWGIQATWRIDSSRYPKLEYKVQYGESDHAFVCRLLEEAGIAFTYEDEGGGAKLCLGDRYETGAMRSGGALPFVDNPNQQAEREFVSAVSLSHEVRPGAFTLADYDFRRPGFDPKGLVRSSDSTESQYEQYHYEPGALLTEGHSDSMTPVADDKGVARHDGMYGENRALRMMFAARADKRAVRFQTNVIDLWPGRIMSIGNHPHPDIGDGARLLMTHFNMSGTRGGEWVMHGRAVFTDIPHVPKPRTHKPRVSGVQSATVVGPSGQEIHTDEFGRVRVQFPWDRQGKFDDNSSCWIRVSQGWAGTGYGMIVTPRIGQEVLVGFLEGDPDQPIIVGRVFNATHVVPYKLPDNKTRSTWKSDSSLGSDGFNEIMFEDKKGEELVWEQAQKNRRRLVKNDETITIGHNRQKLVKNDEDERTLGFLKVFVGKDQDIVIKQNKRELIEGDSHLSVMGTRTQQVAGKQSLTVKGDRHELVAKNHALSVGEEFHVSAGTALVIEASRDLTLKGPGGFIRIDSGGVTICGTEVRINSGGSPGSGQGADADEPEAPQTAVTDDVSKTLIGQ